MPGRQRAVLSRSAICATPPPPAVATTRLGSEPPAKVPGRVSPGCSVSIDIGVMCGDKDTPRHRTPACFQQGWVPFALLEKMKHEKADRTVEGTDGRAGCRAGKTSSLTADHRGLSETAGRIGTLYYGKNLISLARFTPLAQGEHVHVVNFSSAARRGARRSVPESCLTSMKAASSQSYSATAAPRKTRCCLVLTCQS